MTAPREPLSWPAWPDLRRKPATPRRPGRAGKPVVLGRTFCATCGRWRQLCDFSVRPSTGEIRSSCMACERAKGRHRIGADPRIPRKIGREPADAATERYKRNEALRKSDPVKRQRRSEQVRDANRRYYARVREDPEKWALLLERNRFANEAKRRQAGATPRQPTAALPRTRSLLAVGPFRRWLAEYLGANGEDSLRMLAERCGISDRRLRDHLANRDTRFVSLQTVDGVLVAGGAAPDVLHDLYPTIEMESECV